MKALIRGITFRSVLVTSLALLVALTLISVTALNQTRQSLTQQLAQKALVETEQTARRIVRALELGIPLDQLVGFDQLFRGFHDADPNIVFLAIVDVRQNLVHAAGLPAAQIAPLLDLDQGGNALNYRQTIAAAHLLTVAPLVTDGAEIGHVVLGYDEAAITRPIRDNLIDVIILLLVILLLSFEVLLFMFTVSAVLPAQTALTVLASVSRGSFAFLHGQVLRDEMGRVIGRLNQAIRRISAGRGTAPTTVAEPRIIGVRLLAFLFVFAEELARPIMAPFFRDIATAGSGFTDESVIGWVLGVHMIVVAIVMPLTSLYCQRVGHRRLYVLGAIIATMGLIGTGLAQGFWDLLAWRGLSGAGYAITFTACQAFVLENTERSRRSQAIAMMVSGIMLADICGPALGGVLAGQIGARATFLVGAGIALLAVALVPLLMGRIFIHASDDVPARVSWAAVVETVHNPRLLLVVFMVAAPAKFMLAGYLYYLVPMLLFDTGADIAEIGRVLMIYGLIALLLGPLFARLADRLHKHALMAGLGGVISGLGLLPTLVEVDLLVVICGVAALGIGQALSIPAQVAVAISVSGPAIARHGQDAVMAVMRLVERLCGGVGPIVAGSLAQFTGYDGAMGIFGVAALTLGLGFHVLFTISSRPSRRRGRDKKA